MKVTLNVLMLIMVYGCCTFTINLSSLIYLTGWRFADFDLLIECGALLSFSNSLVNPVIYLLRDNRFRKVLKEIKIRASTTTVINRVTPSTTRYSKKETK